MKTKEWDEVPTIIGLSECGHVVPIDKPIHELSEDDRNKLDAIYIDGKGEKALYSDGQYKRTYTKEKTDEIVAGLKGSIEENAEAIENNKEAIEANKEAIESNAEAITENGRAIIENKEAIADNKEAIEANAEAIGINKEAIEANAEAIAENGKAIAENKEAIADNKEAIEANAEAIGKLREDSENAVSELRDEVADNYLALAGNTEQTPITGDVYISERIVARQTGEEGTQYRVMLDGTEAGTEHFGSTLAHTNVRSSDRPTINGKEDIAYLSDIGTVVWDVAELQEDLSLLEERVDRAEEDIEANAEAIESLQFTTEAAFEAVNDSLSGLDARVTVNEVNISQNANEIEQLREDLANQEKFRGYFETTAEVTTIPDPTNGDYAWNAESGTVWLYNGETWYDSEIIIPDQTVEAYEAVPRMDGEGDAGATNRYARGDHQHPSDDSKADLSDLNDYLALAGNTQTTRMTGDIWMSTDKAIKLSNSGKSYLVQDSETNATQLHGNDVGGVDILAPNGTVKVNGDRVITEMEYQESLIDISELQVDVAENTSSIAGLDERLSVAESGIGSNEAAIADLQAATEAEISALKSGIEENLSSISGLDGRLTGAEAGIEANEVAISELKAETEFGFEAVNESLEGLDERITDNSKNIALNSSDINFLREDLASRELFRGYYETIAEVTTIKNPVTGNYAWCAETGTVWMYNEVTWFDSTTPIPDQTVEAYEGTPRMDGAGDAGITNRYARGDHQHPSDDSKANVSDLEDYLSLKGNTQESRMTGDIWVASGQKVRLNNSGNSYVGQGENNNTEIVSSGTGGIDLNTANGTVKANGEEVVTYDSNDHIVAHNNIVLGNDKKIVGTGADGAAHNLIGKNRFGIIEAGSKDVPFNISSSVRPTVKVADESGEEEVYEVAFLGDVTGAQSDLQEQVSENASEIASLQENVATNSSDITGLKSQIGEHTSDISGLHTQVEAHSSDIDELQGTVSQNVMDIQANKDAISVNKSDIESIQAELASQEHFRGYFATTAEVTTIENPKSGDYAYNAESGTKWAYNGDTWYDTLNIIPDQTVEAYDGLPLVDEVASAGSINQYARGDHRHPTDMTRASAVDLAATSLSLSELESNVSDYHSSNDADISEIKSKVSANELNVSNLTGRVSANETNIHTLTGDVAANTSGVSSLTGRVLANEGKISDLIGGVSVNAADISNLKNRVDGHDSDISGLQSEGSQLSSDFRSLSRDFTDLEGKVDLNKSDIESLQSFVVNQEHFRGYYLTTVEITLLPATSGDYAWNAETGSVWVYDGTVPSWTDSGVPLPVQAVFGSDVLPLMDGEASAGESGSYSRGDHRHPTDTTRAAVTDLPTDVSELNNDAGYITAEALEDYLPLEGGTVTGDLTVEGNIYNNGKLVDPDSNYILNIDFDAFNSITENTDRDTIREIFNIPDDSSDASFFSTLIENTIEAGKPLFIRSTKTNPGCIIPVDFKWIVQGASYERRYVFTYNVYSNYSATNKPIVRRIVFRVYSTNENAPLPSTLFGLFVTDNDPSLYLPLEGGTVTGNLTVEGKLFNIGVNLTSGTDIDTITTPGNYYKIAGIVINGTLPTEFNSSNAATLSVYKSGSNAVYQVLLNANTQHIRTLTEAGSIGTWYSYVKKTDLTSYLSLSGGTLTGDLALNTSHLRLGSMTGSPSLRYTSSDGVILKSATNSTGITIDATENSNINLNTGTGKVLYNDSEIAIVDQLTLAVSSYETTITDSNSFTLANVNEILSLSFERVVLYSDEYSYANGTVTITATDLDFAGTNRVKIIYK